MPMLLVISLGDWARTWQLTCIIPKRIKVNKNIEIGRGIADYFLFPWLDRKHFLTIRNCSVNGHNIAKSTRSLTPPLHQHLLHPSRLREIIFGNQQVALLCNAW
jgi:hypothetical protein